MLPVGEPALWGGGSGMLPVPAAAPVLGSGTGPLAGAGAASARVFLTGKVLWHREQRTFAPRSGTRLSSSWYAALQCGQTTLMAASS